MNLKNTSKYISLILRHKPETIGITLDEHGWANVDELIAGISRTQDFSMEMLEEIVSTDEKQRYSFNDDKTLIRANQGHSIPVDVELEKTKPPKYLYHGTGEKYRESIDNQGLIPKSRLYVHLSADIETAIKVGSRHGKPIVYRVWAGIMQDSGFDFYKSVNGVWLTSKVPTQYIKRETFDEKEINTVVREIDEILLKTELDDEALEDTSRADDIFELEEKYTWEVLQQALFRILIDENRSEDAWYQMAVVFWTAVLESRSRKKDGLPKLKFKKKTIIGLLYYRLRELDYAENLIWSITCELYHLDYCNSMYDPVNDDKIIRKLEKYGLSFEQK
ncbi:MAG: RNA 2'-phosphotransferase [Eubacterium sp.]|nr:RNA 2'-phosphotransferase [Eubacterium sp.]